MKNDDFLKALRKSPPIEFEVAKPPKPVTFEQAMVWLRKGTPIRRHEWHVESRIFALGDEVYVQLPRFMNGGKKWSVPTPWQPYPTDFLATDWVKA